MASSTWSTGQVELVASWNELLKKMRRPASPQLEQLYDLSEPLTRMLSLQCLYIAACCQHVQHAATLRIVERFTHTWEQRLSSFRRLPDGTERCGDTADAAPELMIGLIGCGLVGSTLAFSLLDGGFTPSQLLVSSRSPHKLKEVAARGVYVTIDNESVAMRCHLVLLAVLPAHIPEVIREIKPVLSPSTIVVSVALGVSQLQLQRQLGIPAALRVSASVGRLGREQNNGNGLPPHALLDMAAETLFPNAAACAQLARMLRVLLDGLELPDEAVMQMCEAGVGITDGSPEIVEMCRRRLVRSMRPVVAGTGVVELEHSSPSDANVG